MDRASEAIRVESNVIVMPMSRIRPKQIQVVNGGGNDSLNVRQKSDEGIPSCHDSLLHGAGAGCVCPMVWGVILLSSCRI